MKQRIAVTNQRKRKRKKRSHPKRNLDVTCGKKKGKPLLRTVPPLFQNIIQYKKIFIPYKCE